MRFRTIAPALILMCGTLLGGMLPQPAAVASLPDAARKAPHRIDPGGDRITAVPNCQTALDSDCIAGLRVRTGGVWRTATLKEVRVEPSGGPGFEPGQTTISTWEYQSATEGLVGVTLWSVMYPRGVTYRGKDYLLHGLELGLWRLVNPPYANPLDGVPFDCSTGNPETCLLSPPLPKNDYFEVTARTSWLKDNGISVEGLDWSIEQNDTRAGTEWTLGGRQALVSVPRTWKDDMPAEGWRPAWRFLLAHAGDGLHDSAFDPRCAEFGAPWQAGNTPGGGRLHWVKSKQTLDFEVHAPHLDPHGKPLIGNFVAQIPLAWLRCFARKKLNPAYFTVQVVNEDGEEKVATTSLRVRQGTVFVRATGFTFSEPIIRLTTTKTKR